MWGYEKESTDVGWSEEKSEEKRGKEEGREGVREVRRKGVGSGYAGQS